MTYPVDNSIASASDFAGVQAGLVVQVLIPVLFHWMLAVCQKRVLLFGLGPVANGVADRAASSASCAVLDCSIPFMSMLTLPCDNLAAFGSVVMCSSWVLVTELGSNHRSLGGK